MTAIVNKPSIPGVDFPFSTSAPSSTSSPSSFSQTAAAASSSGGYCKPSYWCNFAICPKKQKTDNNVPSADEYGAASSSVTNGARSLMSQTAQMVNRFQLHANLVKLSSANNNNNNNHNNANHNSDNNPNNSMNSPPSVASTTTMSPRSQDTSMFIPIVNTPLTSAIEKNQDQTLNNNNNHHRHSSTFPNNIACHEDEFIHVPLQTPLRVNNDNNQHGENEEKYNNENEYENDSGYEYQQDDDDDIDALPGSETPDLENFDDDDDDDDVDVDVDLGNSMGSLQISQQLPQQSMCSPEQETPIIPSDDNENDNDNDNGHDNNNDNGEVDDAVVSRVGNNDIHSHIIDDYADSRSVVEHRANDDDDFVMVADEQDANQREILSPDDYDDLP